MAILSSIDHHLRLVDLMDSAPILPPCSTLVVSAFLHEFELGVGHIVNGFIDGVPLKVVLMLIN